MIIPVHMLAFMEDKNTIRYVDVPDDEYIGAGTENILELVFKYGQNDFQNVANLPSVSVGDVVEWDGKYWMVMGTGWKNLSQEEFDALRPPTSFHAYTLGIKERIKEE